MVSVNLLRKCRQNILRCYEEIYKQLDKIENPEERVSYCVGICTLVCFSIGMTCDIIGYVCSGSYLLLATNLVGLTVYAVTPVLYVRTRMNVTIVMALLLFTVQTNISISIVYNYYEMASDDSPPVYYDLFIGFLACMLASQTLRRRYVLLLCLMPLASLATVLITSPAPREFSHFLSLCLAYVSPPILLTYIRKLMWGAFRRKYRLLASEKVMEDINEKFKFALTAKEVYLCCLILEDKSIAEISQMLYINESSVRANRSRIRRKLMLDKETNLKAHLIMLVNKENKECEEKFPRQGDDDSK